MGHENGGWMNDDQRAAVAGARRSNVNTVTKERVMTDGGFNPNMAVNERAGTVQRPADPHAAAGQWGPAWLRDEPRATTYEIEIPTLPAGYNPRAFRRAEPGETVLDHVTGKVMVWDQPEQSQSYYLILETSWQPPACVQDGWKIFRALDDQFYVTNGEVRKSIDGRYMVEGNVAAVVKLRALCALWGEPYHEPPQELIRVDSARPQADQEE